MADYKDHLDCLTADAVVSAQKALDFLDGNQLCHIEALLDCEYGGIKHWRKRGVLPVFDNLTKKIITRSALSYSEEPQRVLYVGDTENDEATELYNELTEDLGYTLPAADQVARLLKVAIVLAQSVESADGTEKLLFSVLHRGNCDVDYDHQTGCIKSLMYQSAGCSAKGHKLYHYWTPQFVQDIEVDDSDCVVAYPAVPHNYGCIPAAILWDTGKPRAGFWPKCSHEEIIRLNEIVNVDQIETRFAARMQKFPMWISNAEIPNGTVLGPDAVVELNAMPGDQVYFESKSAQGVQSSVTAFDENLRAFVSDVADGWGVNLRVAGSAAADSGFKLVVEEVWNLKTQQQRQRYAEKFENDLFAAVKAISDDRGLGIPADAWLTVDFAEPSLPVDHKSEWDITKEKIALKYMSVEEAWRKENPDITPEQIAERKAEINAGKLPTFDGLANADTTTV